jgi:hypothetical protein
MIFRKAFEDGSESAGRTRCFEHIPARVGAIVEGRCRHGFSLFSGRRHLVRVTVAAVALSVAGRGHWPAAQMFLVTRGAGAITHDVRLMK